VRPSDRNVVNNTPDKKKTDEKKRGEMSDVLRVRFEWLGVRTSVMVTHLECVVGASCLINLRLDGVFLGELEVENDL
jgi:hypothetical protein